MSYRSVKRVLGETSLERKCRFLFGACLLVLITLSFWFFGAATERLVHEKNEETGRRLVDATMLKSHIRWYETKEEWKDFVRAMTDNLENLDYKADFLALEETEAEHVLPPGDEEEEKILRDLKAKYEQWLKELEQTRQSRALAPFDGADTQAMADTEATMSDSIDPLKDLDLPFDHRHVLDLSEYHYYQPVYWKKSCQTVACHASLKDRGVLPVYEAVMNEDLPFRVVRVVIPYKKTQEALNKNRAILLALAIVTVFLAMAALYIVVRYVIVKPLQHLRDVSDEISSGNNTVRAQIKTNDEFEDLAHSFNRMLRHQVEAHEELRDVNADLDAKVDELAQANMQLYEANRLKSDFLANMSHELRTPLNSIIGFSDVLQGIDSLNEKQKRYVRNIGQSGRVLLDMINDILDLAKMESGKTELSPTEFSIDAVVRAQCNLMRSLTEDRNIDLEVISDPQRPPLYQDQGKVQQIITNLLSNSIKFTPEGGRIVISIDRDDVPGVLILRVMDTGVGIAEEDREVIFEKFRQGAALKQGDELTREYTGTGLGLSIVKELCKLLGGEIAVESELGKGSVFTVRLPWSLQGHPSHRRVLPDDGHRVESPIRADILASRRQDENVTLDPEATPHDDKSSRGQDSASSAVSATSK